MLQWFDVDRDDLKHDAKHRLMLRCFNASNAIENMKAGTVINEKQSLAGAALATDKTFCSKFEVFMKFFDQIQNFFPQNLLLQVRSFHEIFRSNSKLLPSQMFNLYLPLLLLTSGLFLYFTAPDLDCHAGVMFHCQALNYAYRQAKKPVGKVWCGEMPRHARSTAKGSNVNTGRWRECTVRASD